MDYNNKNRRGDKRPEAGRDGKSFNDRNIKGGSRYGEDKYRREQHSSSRNYADRGNYDREKGSGGNRFGNSDNRKYSKPNRNFSGDERSFDRPRRDYRGDRDSSRQYQKPFYNSESTQEKLKFRSKKELNETHTETDGKRKRKRIATRTDNYNSNDKYSKKKQFAYKQSYIDPNKPIRLNKYLANAGVCSRREADDFIQAGVISVNGDVVSELGTKVLISDKVMFHNQPVSIERKVYILLNKPKDCVTTTDDPHAKFTVMDIVKNACSERIYPVGRLDRNTTGVLLLTNDGELASRLTHPKFEKRKIYEVKLDNDLSSEDFDIILNIGVDLGDFTIKADALSYVNEDDRKTIGIEIHSGQNRVIRRIFEKAGYKVLRLDRVYYAGLTKKNVPRGKYRFLNEKEVSFLKMNSGG